MPNWPPAQFFGPCGTTVGGDSPCSLVWYSAFRNKVGSYPSDLLPSRRTTWHASSNGQYSFTAPLIGGGETFGLPFGGLIGFFQFGPPQSDFFAPQSHFIVIFARTANRLDVSHVVTQAEMDTLDSGIIKIDAGEYVFQALAITDEKGVVVEAAEEQGELTDAERAEIEESGETEDDRIFRKLFDISVPDNRLHGIEINRLGVEYRFDNGSPKATAALKGAGIGDLNNPSYLDASSKILLVKATPEESESFPDLKAGDTIYLSYVGVKEHYIRQSVDISWSIQAVSNPPECYSFPSKVKVSNYRFYEWEIQPDDPQDLPVRLAGWRIVESFNIPANFIAPIGVIGDAVLGDFILGNPLSSGGAVDFVYLPAEIRETELRDYIADRSSWPSYPIQITEEVGGVGYHLNSGIDGNRTAYEDAEWWTRGNIRYYSGYTEATQHLFFNVHQKALNKRDVDKFGIDRYLAQELQQDINKGKLTFFPFMDDQNIDDPARDAPPTGGIGILGGAKEALSSSNTKFEPVQPVSGYTTANAISLCGIGGSQRIGYTGFIDGVVAGFNFQSNLMTERFEKDTKVLVERHFTYGQVGRGFVALQGLGILGGRVLSCVGDPSRNFAFLVHNNDDGFLVINPFKDGLVRKAMRTLVYRPDQEAPDIVDNNDPQPNQFESLLGYSGMMGDMPGYKPGKIISASSYAKLQTFNYKTTSSENVKEEVAGLEDDQIEEVTITRSTGKITIPLISGYYGRTSIDYSYEGDAFDIMLIFRTGAEIEGVVDSVHVEHTNSSKTLVVDHKWMKGSTIEIVGDKVDDLSIDTITISQLDSNKTIDFLENKTSSTSENKNALLRLDLLDDNLFFESDTMSIGEDENSRLFIFFNDKDDGISCLQNDDFSTKWNFHYGIVESINDLEAKHPFVVHSFGYNSCFLFYLFKGKILCKKIKYSNFLFEDAFIVERFEDDRLDQTSTPPTERIGLFSASGRALRRDSVSYIAAGDLSDGEFLEMLGKSSEESPPEDLDAFEERTVEKIDKQGNLTTELIEVRRHPTAIGAHTALVNRDVDDIYFSVYRNESGVMRLFFLSSTEGSSIDLLQCQFSVDDGISWYNQWEFIEHSYNRLRIDPDTKTQFIDLEANGESTAEVEKSNPFESNQSYPFGVSIHGRNATRDEAGEITGYEPTAVESPYVFYQPTTQKIFVFYIYQGCLLCKVLSDALFRNNGEGMDEMKEVIEQNTKSFFIDGNLGDPTLRLEFHRYVVPETGKRIKDGRIVFPHQLGKGSTGEEDAPTESDLSGLSAIDGVESSGMSQFDQDRNISAQRVCAYELSNGNIRVFYKPDSIRDSRAAIWTGSFWYVEDLMKDPGNTPEIDLSGDG